ncbi:MucR family transcriptional regulator [Geobacter sp. DSM 9736]|uniref:MucR family transcriptional regulator n=1 Tax=Geobacter sp. DSM 9736 TaxID=1277350 RepID=UPI000B508C96|nr:MucR family transcriptional regulator [Geobacter sp. DSM 9736]SNB46121.1 transcriptional regulator, MucR family [Geobacter sp. DSM 9736]
MATLLEMVSEIVSAHASSTALTTEELIQEIEKVHGALKVLESGGTIATEKAEVKPALTLKQAFRKNEVICMICGKGGMKALTRHLKKAHDITPRDYRKQFGIPRTQSLTASSFSESKRRIAEEKGLITALVQARNARVKKGKGKASTKG